eukprot:Gb_32284 [translate_table: standard]
MVHKTLFDSHRCPDVYQALLLVVETHSTHT